MSQTNRERIETLREGYRIALQDTGYNTAIATLDAEKKYPFPMKTVPYKCHCSNGSSFKIENGLVWMTLSGGPEWMRSSFCVADLVKLGVLAKQPTIEVEDME